MPGGNGHYHETSQMHSGKHSRYGNDGDSQYKQIHNNNNHGEENKNNSQMIGIDGSVYSGLEIEEPNADMDQMSNGGEQESNNQ